MVVLEPTNLLLLACALIYLWIGEPAEAAILLVFVAAISGLDALQQRRSRRALAELARLSAPPVRLRRDGLELQLPADQVRLGDLLRLEEGDRLAPVIITLNRLSDYFFVLARDILRARGCEATLWNPARGT